MADQRLLFSKVGHVQWETLAVPAAPDPHTVVVDTLCSLISLGTELALYTGSHIGFTLPNPPFEMMPQRPGYALVGLIRAVGEEVTGLEIGQRVLVEAAHGTAAAVDVRRTTIVPLPDQVSHAQGTLVRMAGIALTAVRAAPVQLGAAVVVYGLGLVGQLAAQLFRLNGGEPVIGVDRLGHRLEVARANDVIVLDAANQDVPSEISRLTAGRGPDLVVEATGSAAVVSLCLELVARGGRVVLLGSTRGRADLDVYSQIHRKGVQILGAHESIQDLDIVPGASWTKERNLELLARLFAQERLHSQGLISHTIRPDELLSVYDDLADRPQDYLGVLVDWQ
jgi:2-desacetyl-2-hydroxyethyl bacteriochlorophyllide A dehydrogenase